MLGISSNKLGSSLRGGNKGFFFFLSPMRIDILTAKHGRSGKKKKERRTVGRSIKWRTAHIYCILKWNLSIYLKCVILSVQLKHLLNAPEQVHCETWNECESCGKFWDPIICWRHEIGCIGYTRSSSHGLEICKKTNQQSYILL